MNELYFDSGSIFSHRATVTFDQLLISLYVRMVAVLKCVSNHSSHMFLGFAILCQKSIRNECLRTLATFKRSLKVFENISIHCHEPHTHLADWFDYTRPTSISILKITFHHFISIIQKPIQNLTSKQNSLHFSIKVHQWKVTFQLSTWHIPFAMLFFFIFSTGKHRNHVLVIFSRNSGTIPSKLLANGSAYALYD